ncbi:MAG: rod shape-determining protein RodA [Candidatus Eisenbacteria bacterium]|nr:rod shape-determining protein RodA [Candidatus Eisenbacteria bacterium]
MARALGGSGRGAARQAAFWDGQILLPVMLLVVAGALAVYSATVHGPGGGAALFWRHLAALLVGALAAATLAYVPLRGLEDLSPLFYGAAMLLLLTVLFAGEAASGARRWLAIGPLRLQPSEPAKVATILLLAHYLARKRCDLRRIGSLAGALALIALPALLVMQQPDLGTALAFSAVGLVMLIWAGLPGWILILLASPLVTAGLASLKFLIPGPPSVRVIAWVPYVLCAAFLLRRARRSWYLILLFVLLQTAIAIEAPRIWEGLEPYQQARVSAFLYPERDPAGSGYQVIQSQIAIGSGGWLGAGFRKGSQKALAFLPRQHTDFIYSVVGEEFGFVGAATILLLYAVLIFRGAVLARESRGRFGSLVAIGVTTLIFYHTAVNIAMTLGLAPVTGLPLPFLSFGGSFLVTSLGAVGLLIGVGARRREQ